MNWSFWLTVVSHLQQHRSSCPNTVPPSPHICLDSLVTASWHLSLGPWVHPAQTYPIDVGINIWHDMLHTLIANVKNLWFTNRNYLLQCSYDDCEVSKLRRSLHIRIAVDVWAVCIVTPSYST